MAGNKIEFVMSLIDKMSRPARNAANALEDMRGNVHAFNGNPIAKFGKAMGRTLGSMPGRVEMASKGLGRFAASVPVRMGNMAQAFKGTLPAAFAATKQAAGFTATAVMGATLAFAGLAATGAAMGGKMAWGAMSLAVASKSSFGALTGSAEMGDALYTRVLDMAAHFRKSPEDLLTSTRSLLAAGLDTSTALKLVQASLDLKAVNPAADMKSVAKNMGDMKGKGVVAADELNSLAESGGLAKGHVLKALAGIMKIDMTDSAAGIKKVNDALGSGKVTGEQGVAAVMMAVMSLTKTGNVGEFADKARNSLGSLVTGFKSLPDQYLLRMKADGGPITTLLSSIMDYLDPNGPKGKAIIEFLNVTAKKLTDMFKGVDAGKVITDVLALASALTGGLKKGFDTLMGPIKTVFGGLDGGKDTMKQLGSAISFVATVVGGAFAALLIGGVIVLRVFMAAIAIAQSVLSAVWKGITTVIDGIAKTIAEFVKLDFWTALKNLGSRIIDGLIAGIKAGIELLKTTWNSVVSILPESVKKKLQIASPSKLMYEMGGFTVEGFTGGLEDGKRDVAGASDIFATPTIGAAAGGIGGGGATSRAVGDVTVNIYATGQMNADDVGRVARREIVAAFESAGLAL